MGQINYGDRRRGSQKPPDPLTCASEDMKRLELPHAVRRECKKTVQPLWETGWQFVSSLDTE